MIYWGRELQTRLPVRSHVLQFPHFRYSAWCHSPSAVALVRAARTGGLKLFLNLPGGRSIRQVTRSGPPSLQVVTAGTPTNLVHPMLVRCNSIDPLMPCRLAVGGCIGIGCCPPVGQTQFEHCHHWLQMPLQKGPPAPLMTILQLRLAHRGIVSSRVPVVYFRYRRHIRQDMR